MNPLNLFRKRASHTLTGVCVALFMLNGLVPMGVARAATITWTNTAGGNWSAANNWNPNQVPGSNDTASVTVAGIYAITLDANASLGNLALGGAVSGVQTLQASGFTLAASNALVSSNGILSLTNSTLAGEILVNQGTIHVSGGSNFINVANFTNLATLSVGLDSPVDYGTFNFLGDLILTGTLEVCLNNGYVPAPGSSFPVLSSGSAITGSFTNFEYVPPVVIWRPVYSSSALTMVAYPPISLSETNVAVNLVGTPLQKATLLTSTNLNVPLHNWEPVATNTFDVTRFLSFPNSVNSSNPAQFFARQPTYTIGGTISGLTPGDAVVLNDNGGDHLTVTTNGSFTFSTPLPYGSAYMVTSDISSEGAICVVTNSTGTIETSNITNVVVTCSPIHECASGLNYEDCTKMVEAGCIAITNVGGGVSYDCNDTAYQWLLYTGPNGTGCRMSAYLGGQCNSAHAILQ